MKLHERIAALRGKRGFTQQHVADFLGVSRGAYANYELGSREPDAESLAKLADLFNVTIDYLVTGKSGSSEVSPEESEFLKWVEENLEGTFFYDFDKSPEDAKKYMMETLRMVWEREKGRKPGQKQGE